MRGLLKRRLAKLAESYEKRRAIIAKKRLATEVSLAKRLGLIELYASRKDSPLFIGYAEAALGLGESFRNMLTAIESAGVPFAIYPFNKDVEARRIGSFLETRYDREGIYDINVAYMAVDQLPHYFSELQKQVLLSRYNILRTYWELAEAPPVWGVLLERIDELWVPNSFVADAFRPIFNRTITVIPVCIDVSRKQKFLREHFGLDNDRFYFMFSFDYYSGTARKNPLGVVQAFSYAFPDQQMKVGLLIKTTGPRELDPTVSQQLENVSHLDKRIKILNGSVERDEMLSLIDDCDCYVSLHRSEGFGLGMAEALALERPVIATDYSGNREFLTANTGFPVRFSLRKLMPGEYPMGDGQSWAEPDLSAAVYLMRTIFDDRAERQRRSANGKQYIEAHYAGRTVARMIQDRLDEIRRRKTSSRRVPKFDSSLSG